MLDRGDADAERRRGDALPALGRREGDAGPCGLPIGVGEHADELVAAHANNQVVRPHAVEQALDDQAQGAIAGGDAYYNTLSNAGTIVGTKFTPLALPVYASLPPVLIRPAGTSNVAVPDNGTASLDEGAYQDLNIGRGAKLTLTGGGYAFRSITIARDGELRYSAPIDVVVSGRADFGTNAIVAPPIGSTLTAASARIQVDGTSPAIHVGQSGKVSATLYATAGALTFEQNVEANGAFFARDILIGSGGHFTINSAFNQPPVA